jgi:hypothetical protein
MRLFTTRFLALLAIVTSTLVASSGQAMATGQAPAICSPGQMELTIHWPDAQDAPFCIVADALQGMPTSDAIVGLVVRGPDDAVTTVSVVPAPNVAGNVQLTTSHSISSSSSTTCVDGHCTTVSNQVICNDGTCSTQP